MVGPPGIPGASLQTMSYSNVHADESPLASFDDSDMLFIDGIEMRISRGFRPKRNARRGLVHWEIRGHRTFFVTLAVSALVACTSQQIKNGDTELQAGSPAADSGAAFYRADAVSIQPLIARTYAYLDRFPAGIVPVSEALADQAEQVTDLRSLIRYAERVVLSLADHHAILGSSLADSWALVPSYADLWILEEDGVYVVDAVREGSPAERARIRPGDVVEHVAGALVIRFNDSLGSNATIAAFDGAMSLARPGQRIVVDLRDTPSGGTHPWPGRFLAGLSMVQPTTRCTTCRWRSGPRESRANGSSRCCQDEDNDTTGQFKCWLDAGPEAWARDWRSVSTLSGQRLQAPRWPGCWAPSMTTRLNTAVS